MRYNAIEKRIETRDRTSTYTDRERQNVMRNTYEYMVMKEGRESDENGVYENNEYWPLVIVAVSIDTMINRCLFDQVHTSSGFYSYCVRCTCMEWI